jgi:hypothetical protein
MGKKEILTGLLLVLLMVPTVWAGNSVTISMSCTIPSIPGVNAPARIPETLIRDYQREDVANKNTAATVEEIIEKEERKETLLAQGEKVTTAVKTIYSR